jgi:calcium-dependent protein kinase
MAVFFDKRDLPLADLGLDGTAWFMAPELLSSEAYPASDVWAAGVMAYQLLSGYLPFDDHRNPDRPALSLVWCGRARLRL